MNVITPRPYQAACVDTVCSWLTDPFCEFNRFIYTMPTGTGKTNTFSWILQRMFESGMQKALIVAHREELLDQAQERICDILGMNHEEIAIEQADLYAPHYAKVIVGSIQTITNPNRLKDWKPDLIICDESHHASSRSFLRLFERMGVFSGDTKLIGCTATAKRGDNISLYAYDLNGEPTLTDPKHRERCVFQKLIFDYTITDAIEEGWLAPIRGFRVITNFDLSNVKKTAGDFNEKELQKVVVNINRTELAIDKWNEIGANNRQTLVFCAGVEHSHMAAELWQKHGFKAAAIDGGMHRLQRREILGNFRSGEVQVLCNDSIVSEGTDIPNISCIVHLRPTKSWPRYVQTTGRGLRLFPDKQDCFVIDLVDITKGKDLCTAPSIVGLPPSFDLQGHSLTEALPIFRETSSQKEMIIRSVEDIQRASWDVLTGTVQLVNLLKQGGAKSHWKADGNGNIRHTGLGKRGEAIIGFDQNGKWKLTIRNPNGEERNRFASTQTELETIWHYADKNVERLLPVEPKPATPIATFSSKQLYWLKRAKLSEEQIAQLTRGQASAIIGREKEKSERAKIGGW